jgi:hypothetical protein
LKQAKKDTLRQWESLNKNLELLFIFLAIILALLSGMIMSFL